MANERRRARRWADLVAIIAGVVALGNAMWGPIIFTTMYRELARGDRGVDYNWMAFGIGGLLALLGVALAQKRAMLGRPALALGGLLLAIAPLFYERKPPLPLATSVVLGLAMLIATPFLGPMPARGRSSGAPGI